MFTTGGRGNSNTSTSNRSRRGNTNTGATNSSRGNGSNNNRGTGSRIDVNTNTRKDYSKEWLETIQAATGCLSNNQSTIEELDNSIQFLNGLEAQLLVKERKWHLPPNMLPPVWDDTVGIQEPQSAVTPYSDNNSRLVPSALLPMEIKSNRFAVFQDDDDDDDEEEDDDDDDSDDIDNDGGDEITFSLQQGANDTKQKKTAQPYMEGMDMRRLMIRIYTAQSDIFAAQASVYRKQRPPAWSVGATKYTHCLHKIHSSLILADSEISKWMNYAATHGTDTAQLRGNATVNVNRIVELLTEDANIVEITVYSMTTNRDQFITAAKQCEEGLIRRLQPQWKTRDDVKQQIGTKRWKNNRNPKNEYAAQRIDDERELKDISTALKFLATLDTSAVEESTKQLRNKIRFGQDPTSTPDNQPSSLSSLPPVVSSNGGQQQTHNAVPPLPQPPFGPIVPSSVPSQQQQQHQQLLGNDYNNVNNVNNNYPTPDGPLSSASALAYTAPTHQRYNGIRPTDLSRRVNIQLYPDPTMFGWTFTGSYNYAEFFEKDNVKLDWYYTTATIKTSLVHPTQGSTQLFGSRVDPSMYRNILENPRTHTNRRYQRRGDGGGGNRNRQQ